MYLKNIKVRPTIISIVTILIVLTAIISLSSQYYFLKDLSYTSTKKLMNQINEKTKERVERFDKESRDLISILELTHNIGVYPKSDIQPTLLKKITRSILNTPYIYAIYIGYDNDSFYEVINLNVNSNLRNKFSAKSDERWLVVKIFNKGNKRLRLEQFLNHDLEVTRNSFKKVDYVPTQRPWYIKATKNSGETIKTDPYLFSNLENFGVTYARELENKKSVIALDISLDSLSGFLKKQTTIKDTKLFLYDKNKELISSNIVNSSIKDEFLKEVNNSTLSDNNSFRFRGKDYFVSKKKLIHDDEGSNTLITLLPEDEIMKESNEKISIAILLTFTFIIMTLPLIWIFTKILTKPLEELESENKKVKNRDFNNVKQIKTPIDEIYHLSKSMVDMSKSIKEFQDSQDELIDSIVKLIASTIDAKSKYTAGHCERVPELTLMLTNEANKSTKSVFKDFKLETEDEIKELSIAAWLHDCGKVTTPIFVVDKATKLETIYNRIHEIRTRFEVVHRDFYINALERIMNGENKDNILEKLKEDHLKLQSDFEFIANSNVGGEFMKEDDKNRIHEIAKQEWTPYFDNRLGLSIDEEMRLSDIKNDISYILEDRTSDIIPRTEIEEYKDLDIKMDIPNNLYNFGEIYNLTIEKGTLTDEERFKINEHIIMTIKMLEHLPLPDYLKKIPEYASAHHETLIGTGYPRKLTKEDMSVPARIMAIADIFEALTASDRPYKKAKSLSESMKIMSFMVKDKHLDEDLFRLFLESGIYMKYATKFLDLDQIDQIDIKDYI